MDLFLKINADVIFLVAKSLRLMITRGQFHQRSMRSFYIRKLRAAFLCLHFRLVLYWNKTVGAKAAHRRLVKLSPDYLEAGKC